MTRERSGGSEPQVGDDGALGPQSDEDGEARLRALLSVPLDVPPPAGRSDDVDERDRPRPSAVDLPTPGGGDGSGGVGTRIGIGAVVSVIVLLALFATGAGLVYAGTRIIRSSTEGEVLAQETDPTAPGYEALVTPTPTLLVVHATDGAVSALTVLTLPDPAAGGGGVILVPRRTVSDMPVFGYAPIAAAYDLGNADVQAEAVGDVLTAGIGEVAVIDSERWAGLVAPVAPLSIDNPDDLEVRGDVLFPAGDLELEADDVATYLEAEHDGESDLARLFRHRTFWEAWLEAVAASEDPAVVPGELEVGIGRFVRALAAGSTVVETLPVEPTTLDDYEDEQNFAVERDELAGLVAELIPLPRSPRPGVRPRVRLLNGTQDLDEARSLALELPPLGVEVAVVGNARSLDEATTEIAYVNPSHEEAARDIRGLLGVGEVVVDERPSDVADITVTLGADHD